MAITLQARIISPTKVLFTGEAEMVACRTQVGEIAFLANHIPFIGALDTCKVRVIAADGTQEVFAVKSGFVEVKNNVVTLLSDLAFASQDVTTQLVDSTRLEESGESGESG
jgi:F-type H+-transporting ATPase subunit epsilon